VRQSAQAGRLGLPAYLRLLATEFGLVSPEGQGVRLGNFVEGGATSTETVKKPTRLARRRIVEPPESGIALSRWPVDQVVI
jgi:hypothetical protein